MGKKYAERKSFQNEDDDDCLDVEPSYLSEEQQSQKSLDQSLYEDWVVAFFKQQKFQPHLTLDEFVAEGYVDNTADAPIFKPIELYIKTGTDMVRFTVERPGDNQWYQRLLFQIAQALGINYGLELKYGDQQIWQYNMSDIIRWPEYAIKLSILEFEPAPQDPDIIAEKRKTDVVKDSENFLKTSEQRFAKRLVRNIYGNKNFSNMDKEGQIRYITNKPQILREVVKALHDPEVYESNDPKAFSEFCSRYNIKDTSKFVNDATQRLIQCACESSYQKGDHRNRRRKNYSYSQEQSKIGTSLNGGDPEHDKLEQALIGTSIFGYVRGMWNNAWHCKQKCVKTCDIPKVCYNNKVDGTSSSSCSESSSNSDSDCSSSDKSNCSDSCSSDEDGDHYARHRTNAISDPYQRYFAPYDEAAEHVPPPFPVPVKIHHKKHHHHHGKKSSPVIRFKRCGDKVPEAESEENETETENHFGTKSESDPEDETETAEDSDLEKQIVTINEIPLSLDEKKELNTALESLPPVDGTESKEQANEVLVQIDNLVKDEDEDAEDENDSRIGRRRNSSRIGSGSRFRSLKVKLARRGAYNPAALAAWIGRRKYGERRFQHIAEMGRQRPHRHYFDDSAIGNEMNDTQKIGAFRGKQLTAGGTEIDDALDEFMDSIFNPIIQSKNYSKDFLDKLKHSLKIEFKKQMKKPSSSLIGANGSDSDEEIDSRSIITLPQEYRDAISKNLEKALKAANKDGNISTEEENEIIKATTRSTFQRIREFFRIRRGQRSVKKSSSIGQSLNEGTSLSGAEMLKQSKIIGKVIDPNYQPVVFSKVKAPVSIQTDFNNKLKQQSSPSVFSRVVSDHPIGGVYDEDEEIGQELIPPMPDLIPIKGGGNGDGEEDECEESSIGYFYDGNDQTSLEQDAANVDKLLAEAQQAVKDAANATDKNAKKQLTIEATKKQKAAAIAAKNLAVVSTKEATSAAKGFAGAKISTAKKAVTSPIISGASAVGSAGRSAVTTTRRFGKGIPALAKKVVEEGEKAELEKKRMREEAASNESFIRENENEDEDDDDEDEDEDDEEEDDSPIGNEMDAKLMSNISNFMTIFKQFKIGDKLSEEFGHDQDFVVFAPHNSVFTDKIRDAVKNHHDEKYPYEYAKNYCCCSKDNGGDFSNMKKDENNIAKYNSIGGRTFPLKGNKIIGTQAEIKASGSFFHPENEKFEFIVQDGLHNKVPATTKK